MRFTHFFYSFLFSEDVFNNDLLIGSWKFDRDNGPNEQPLTIIIYDTNKNIIKKSVDVHGQFTFTSVGNGFYDFCFDNDNKYVRAVTFSLETTLIHNKKNEGIAENKDIQPLQRQFQQILANAKHLMNDLEALKDKEWKSRNLNESTNSRMWWFTFLSLVVLFVTSAYQIYFLKQFFQKKKLI